MAKDERRTLGEYVAQILKLIWTPIAAWVVAPTLAFLMALLGLSLVLHFPMAVFSIVIFFAILGLGAC
jgi:hypothetical protein